MIQSGPELDLLTPESTPDWDRIGFDTLCPRCGYNLRTLTRPKCPECGLDFAWPDILRESGFKSDFLFEHHWRTRPVASLLRTFRKSLRPRRFWTDVSIHDQLGPEGLKFLMVLSTIILVITFHASTAIVAHLFQLIYAKTTWLGAARSVRQYQWYIHSRFLADFGSAGSVLLGLLTIAATIAATTILLVGMRQTLGRCRVRPIQIIRVMSYALLPLSITAPLGFLMLFVIPSYMLQDLNKKALVQSGGLILTWLLFSHYLYCGLKYYLSLPRARLLACTAVFVGMLFTMTVSMFVSVQLRGGF
jgi:hypothetical protein